MFYLECVCLRDLLAYLFVCLFVSLFLFLTQMGSIRLLSKFSFFTIECYGIEHPCVDARLQRLLPCTLAGSCARTGTIVENKLGHSK